jgi:hypothetical protein
MSRAILALKEDAKSAVTDKMVQRYVAGCDPAQEMFIRYMCARGG